MRSMLGNIHPTYCMEKCAVYCAKMVILFIYFHSSWILLLLLLFILSWLILIRYKQFPGVLMLLWWTGATQDTELIVLYVYIYCISRCRWKTAISVKLTPHDILYVHCELLRLNFVNDICREINFDLICSRLVETNRTRHRGTFYQPSHMNYFQPFICITKQKLYISAWPQGK